MQSLALLRAPAALSLLSRSAGSRSEAVPAVDDKHGGSGGGGGGGASEGFEATADSCTGVGSDSGTGTALGIVDAPDTTVVFAADAGAMGLLGATDALFDEGAGAGPVGRVHGDATPSSRVVFELFAAANDSASCAPSFAPMPLAAT